MSYLVYKDERKEEIKRQVDKEKITLGRREDNDIVFFDNFVSRQHALIEKRGDKVFIVDNKSTFGTFVNEEKITERELHYGDKIRVGRTNMLFIDDKSVGGQQVSLWLEEDSQAVKKCKTLRDEILGLKNILETDSLSGTFSKLDQHINDIRNYYTDLEKGYKLASILFEIGKAINFIFDLDILLNLIMDLAVKAIGAERGFIILLNSKGEMELKVARNIERALLSKESEDISHGIANNVLKSGSPIFTTDAKVDERFNAFQSVMVHNIRAVMCVPLKERSYKVFGVIYVDSRKLGGLFSRVGEEFLTAFASQASVAIENAGLYEKIMQEERLRTNLQRYLPQPLVEKMVTERGELYLGGESREITVMFADIRGFTSISEKLTPHDVVEMLNEFFTLMTEEIFMEEGTLDKYIGDCLMAFFGAPMAQEDHAVKAVKSALGMQKKLGDLKKQWVDVGKVYLNVVKDFGIGIGINTGTAVVGNLGTMKRMEYTAIGDTVNLASRLEGIAEANQVIIAENTYKKVRDFFEVKPFDYIKVKGKEEPVKIYSVIGSK